MAGPPLGTIVTRADPVIKRSAPTPTIKQEVRDPAPNLLLTVAPRQPARKTRVHRGSPVARKKRRPVSIRRTQTLDTPTAVAFSYKPDRKGYIFTREGAISKIKQVARSVRADDPYATILVRGLGGVRRGSPVVRERDQGEPVWWSGPPMGAGEIAELDEEELADILYGLDDPEELDIYIREG